jgi:20S proteasome alpha/beta subunit
LRQAACAGNNAHVSGRFRAHRSARTRTIATSLAVAIAACIAAGCAAPATAFVDKIRADADEKCRQGNQPACHTIVQALSDTKVAIESTSPLETQTPACIAGKQEACQQVAVLHLELSGWCSMNNAQACAAVSVGPWPKTWDEPALVDAAKLSCLSGQFKMESNTCQALQMM